MEDPEKEKEDLQGIGGPDPDELNGWVEALVAVENGTSGIGEAESS